MKEKEEKMHFPKIDDFFTTQEERDEQKLEKVEKIAVSSISNCIIFLEISSSTVGIESISVLIIAHASSTKSIALSGKNLSEIYLCDSVAAAINSLSDILTP